MFNNTNSKPQPREVKESQSRDIQDEITQREIIKKMIESDEDKKRFLREIIKNFILYFIIIFGILVGIIFIFMIYVFKNKIF